MILKIAKKNKHTKVISIVDNMIPHEKRMGDRLLTQYFVKTVDGFIAMSEKVKNDIKINLDTDECNLQKEYDAIQSKIGNMFNDHEALNKNLIGIGLVQVKQE